jgi:hypothetical protein
MAGRSPSHDWLEDLEAIAAERVKAPSASHKALSKALDLPRSYVSTLLALQPIFDPPTVEKVRQAPDDYTLSYRSVSELAGLRGHVPDYPRAGRDAVVRILAQRMAPGQITALAAQMAGGKPAKNVGVPGGGPFERIGRALDGWLGLGARSPLGKKEPGAGEEGAAPAPRKAHATSSQGAPAHSKGSKPAWQKPLKLAGGKIYRFFLWLVKLPFRLLSKGLTGLLEGKFAQGIVQLGLAALIFWALLWACRHPGRILGWAAGFSPLRQHAQGSPQNGQGLGNSQSPTTTTETTIPPRRREATKLIKGSTPNSSKPAPNYLPSHAWTSADEDLATVETELAAMPDGPVLIKDFPVEPDASMQPDIAGTRLEDLTDHERYTVRIGRDKKDIQAVVPGSSTLTLGFSKGLLGGLTDPLGGGNNGVKIIWEDIQALHCFEWDVAGDHPKKIYVCALLVPEKAPVIVQCGSPTDMAHFVSALEFWIRNARHGQGAPLGGLPYLHQGVLLNDGGDEKAVWENGPMAKAGLPWGDRLWSVDTDAPSRPNQASLVRALDSLAPGRHNLYFVTRKDWDRANASEDFHSDAPFNPPRRALPLLVP